MDNMIDLLLAVDVPNPQTKEFKHKRLSTLCGGDVVITLRELGFSRTAEIKQMHDDDGEMDVYLLLAGLVSPDLKDTRLLSHYEAITPAELIKKMFRPGEIAGLAKQVEILSGYRVSTIEELKKK